MQSISLGTYDYTHMNHSEPPRVQLCYSYYTVKGKESNPFAVTDPVVGGCGRIPFEGIFEVVEKPFILGKVCSQSRLVLFNENVWKIQTV